VALHWRTASEPNVLGFNVYSGPGTHRVRRNRHIIPAEGLGARGRGYVFRLKVAASVRRAGPYWLQIVDKQGTRSWFGSVSAP
jgi:hypothetical protein